MLKFYPKTLIGHQLLLPCFLLILLASNFISSELKAQNSNCIGDTNLIAHTPVYWSLDTVPDAKGSWYLKCGVDPTQPDSLSIQKIIFKVKLSSLVNSKVKGVLNYGNHPFNSDGKGKWRWTIDPVNDSITVEGVRPPCEGLPGRGDFFIIELSQSGVNDHQKLIDGVGGIVIADVAIGAKSSLESSYLFPNPATSYIDLPMVSCEGATAEIKNAVGQLAWTREISPGFPNRVYIHELLPGLYHVQIFFPEGKFLFFKFVKN